jgi:hypothetical protein
VKRYPLQALETVRRRRAEVTGGRAADAARSLSEAERRASASRRARRELDEVEKRVEAEEGERLGGGRATAADLARQAEWRRAGAPERDRRRAAEQAEERRVSEARSLESAARAENARAVAEVGVVRRHREGWTVDRRNAEELAEEADAQEVWEARTLGPK